MPNTLTERQQEYLDFIREYIKKGKGAPQLKEIAAHFHVTSPTATKTLKVLQEKGRLYFDRDKNTGFYIRTPEFFTPEGSLREIMIAGFLDRYGEVHHFPKNHGHFPFMLPEGIGDIFALEVYQHIPSEGILARDHLIFTNGGEAKPGDICVFPIGDRVFLVRMYEPKIKKDTPFFKLARKFWYLSPWIKENVFWWPLAGTEEYSEYFLDIIKEQQVRYIPIEPTKIVGKIVRLVRRLAI